MKKRIVSIFSFIFVFCLGGCSSQAASIGIIGGADGPTAVFVTSKINWLSVCGWIGAIIIAIFITLMIYRNKKK